MTLKRQLKYYLKLYGMSAAELSRRSGVPQQTISDWLAGVAPRSIPHVKNISEVFEISIDELCFGTTFEKPNLNLVQLLPRDQKIVCTPCIKPEMNSFQNLSELILVMDSDGLIQEVNSGFSKLIGWTALELVSQSVTQFIHPADRLRWREQNRKHFNYGSLVCHFESRMINRNGSIKWVRFNAIIKLSSKYTCTLGEEITEEYPPEVDSVSQVCIGEFIRNKLRIVDHIHNKNTDNKVTVVAKNLPKGLFILCYPILLSVGVFGIMHLLCLQYKNIRNKTLFLSLKEYGSICEILIDSRCNAPESYFKIPSDLLKKYKCNIEYIKNGDKLKIVIAIPKKPSFSCFQEPLNSLKKQYS
jgi:PAS domain S-box-containing protein